jgi:hypothetical protein
MPPSATSWSTALTRCRTRCESVPRRCGWAKPSARANARSDGVPTLHQRARCDGRAPCGRPCSPNVRCEGHSPFGCGFFQKPFAINALSVLFRSRPVPPAVRRPCHEPGLDVLPARGGAQGPCSLYVRLDGHSIVGCINSGKPCAVKALRWIFPRIGRPQTGVSRKPAKLGGNGRPAAPRDGWRSRRSQLRTSCGRRLRHPRRGCQFRL